ncbi:MAG TPA: hypothetical protein VGD06_01880, partial [Acidobacteriota bacterium]
VAALFAALLAASALSGPTVVGDGAEYIGMALSLLEFGSPAPTPQQADVLEAELQRHDLRLQRDALHEGNDGRLHYRHFWLYPALAAPAVYVALGVGLSPAWGFVALNAGLFAAATGGVAAVLGIRLILLLFAGPIIWWLDKPHPEIFVFSLLAAGFALIGRRPAAALIAWGVAAAQYPPIAALLPLAVTLVCWSEGRRSPGPGGAGLEGADAGTAGTAGPAGTASSPRRSATPTSHVRLLAGAGIALLIASIHPVWYLWRLGVPTPFVFWGRPPAVPTLREWGAVLWDLNIGALFNAPLLVAAVLLAAIVRVRSPAPAPSRTATATKAATPSEGAASAAAPGTTKVTAAAEPPGSAADRLTQTAIGTAGGALLLLPVAFAQTVNVNHGGTPGMSRYALWLIPLSIPVLARFRAARTPWAPRAMTVLVVLSVIWSLVYFHPARPESYTEPTSVAMLVWTRAPRLSAPLPEIFSERTRGREPGELPATTPGCEKILLLAGAWPAPCGPAPAPEGCSRPGALCYADRRSSPPGSYRFRPLDGGPQAGYERRSETWPEAYVPAISAALERLRWWEMERTSLADPDPIVRAAHEIDWTAWRSGPGRFFLYAHGISPSGASLTLRLPEPLTGTFYDPATGAALGDARSPDEAGALWNVALPSSRDGAVILIMTTPGFGWR